MRRMTTLSLLVALAAGLESSAAEPDVAKITAALTSKSAEERSAAADSLADLGPVAAAAIPQLTAALGMNEPELRWRAARALGTIGDANSVAALRKAAGDESPLVRAQAIFA